MVSDRPADQRSLGLAILRGAWRIIRETLEIFLESSPRAINVDRLVAEMKQENGVLDIHDMHVWTLGSELYALSCHVVVDDVKVSEGGRILTDLRRSWPATLELSTQRWSWNPSIVDLTESTATSSNIDTYAVRRVVKNGK